MKNTLFICLLSAAAILASCRGGKGQVSEDSSRMQSFGNNSNSNELLGAGSTFAYPLFSKLSSVYSGQTGVMLNYQSIGSAAGILQLTNKAVDFGDSDDPLSDAQLKKMGGAVLQIPLYATTRDSKGGRVCIYKDQSYNGRNLMRAQKLLKMLWWDVHEGQQYFEGLNYTKLSPSAVAVAEKLLRSAMFDGKPILQ